jgi:hypothetical protein
MRIIRIVARHSSRLVTGLAGVCTVAVARADAQLQLASARGDTLRIGYLVHMRGERIHPSDGATTQDIFLRHLRLLLAGRLFRTTTFFVGSDAPNFGRLLADGARSKPWMTIYDAWATYEPADQFKLDVGLIGTPNSHNSIQSISGMLAPDFSPYSFVSTPPSGEKAGRDYAAQVRGYIANGHVEYRMGAFTSVQRPRDGRRPRFLARVVYDLDSTERTVYYTGTTLGVRSHMALGGSIDHQDTYTSFDADLYVDRPLRNGDAISAQADIVRYEGGSTFASLGRQTTSLVEAGYLFTRTRLAPFVQLAIQRLEGDASANQRQTLVGMGYFLHGQKLNIKLAVGRSLQPLGRKSTIAQLSVQAFAY